MGKYEFIPPNLFCIGLSLFVMFSSYKMGLFDKAGLAVEEVYTPGPGLMPFCSASFLLLLSLYLLISPFLKKGTPVEPQTFKREMREKPHFSRIILVLLLLFGYALVLEPLGYLVTTFLALLFLFKMMTLKWKYSLFVSLTTTLITYFGFTYLGLLLPDGIIKLQRYLL